ncbi:hypothetical protein SAY87_020356 [Trapa incisa]|uniref:RING-type E3 ubiquitin transferase n=1 Tax=Trapa incisa TaxID=236973 RepID=A0AAN7K9V1_9MYRT|nr:hypothetical protein SAY87_020356 [Trapa incisa]
MEERLSLFTIPLILLFSLTLNSLLPARASATPNCTRAVCHQHEPEIRFPFRISTKQPPSCGYNYGFEVSCSSTPTQTLLNLPNSGLFTVQGIDYAKQELWINDPDGCLPRRLLSLKGLNLSGSPFATVSSEFFSFFNCSSLDYTKYWINPIACLSSPNYTVFASSAYSALANLPVSCRRVGLASVPVEWPSLFEEVHSSDLTEDLRLRWARPDCGQCEARGGTCGLKANSRTKVQCRDVPNHGSLPRVALYGITVGAGIPGILLLTGLICYLCGRVKSLATGSRARDPTTELATASTMITVHGPSAALTGLDKATIESYPRLVLGKSRRLPRAERDDDAVCAICLSEYQPKETLRAIPDCHHFFHEDCIDHWLSLKGTCPVCRNNPRQRAETPSPSRTSDGVV